MHTILELQDLMLLQVALRPDDLGVARNWVERFVVLLDVLVFEQVFDEHILVGRIQNILHLIFDQ